MMLETNIDDMNAEIYSYLYPKLFEQGALDVYLTNIMMKKNRPAVKVSVLAEKENAAQLEELLFRETTTLGIRKYEVQREILKREFCEVETKWGTATVKIAKKEGTIVNCAPEYEDCKQLAAKFDVPLKKVYQRVSKLCSDFKI
ncbi:MAG: nickel insertion protein [Bacillota bacterium]